MNLSNNIYILIVDDDTKIASLLKKILLNNGFLVIIANDSSEAETLLKYFRIDIILLDYMLPYVNGKDFLKKIRKQNILTPVIMLTAINEMDAKLETLGIGADDYISKPFNSQELILRIKNLLKRTINLSNNNIVNFCNLQFNKTTSTLTRNGKVIALSTLEEDLMQIFTSRLGKVVSKEELLKLLGKSLTEENLNAVNVNIMRLRKKIEDSEFSKCIKTIRNKGFLLKP